MDLLRASRNERVDYVPRVYPPFVDRYEPFSGATVRSYFFFPFVHSLDFNLILYSGFIRQWKNDSRDAFVNSLLPDRGGYPRKLYIAIEKRKDARVLKDTIWHS